MAGPSSAAMSKVAESDYDCESDDIVAVVKEEVFDDLFIEEYFEPYGVESAGELSCDKINLDKRDGKGKKTFCNRSF